MRSIVTCLCVPFLSGALMAATADTVPTVHSHLYRTADTGLVFVTNEGDTLYEVAEEPSYTLDQMRHSPMGTDSGLVFDFGVPDLSGRLYYGFIPDPSTVLHPLPVLFNRSAKIDSGRAEIDILHRMAGRYDMIGWEESGRIRFGYRVIDRTGTILYDGKINVTGKGPFRVDTSIVSGPFLGVPEPNGTVLSFETNVRLRARIECAGQVFEDEEPVTSHVIGLRGLVPDTVYEYTIVYGQYRDTYTLRTAPPAGSRQPFTFAYASDSRANNGGGERDLRGVNAYILKKVAALASDRHARFVQFTGDLIDGYTNSEGRIMLEYANWKRTVDPFTSRLPFVVGFGNHESLLRIFARGRKRVRLDRFPFKTESSEAIFARNTVNPPLGPYSEDGARYDPDTTRIDFPPYGETVFSYTYGNIAMIVLNSNYWYAASLERYPESGGNIHGYIMDNQLKWLQEQLADCEADSTVDHIFVTLHTPIFPNGGHVGDDMWYDGDNSFRPTIAGKPVATGIIERRDQLLDLLVNKSTKVIAVLTGDEHNYNLLHITPDMPIYPDDWNGDRLHLTRSVWQINNGAAGAPYYGREETPWQGNLQTFSTLNALVLIHVDGKTVRCEVINPDTLEPIEEYDL